ncbi:hypothetical protein Nepgr_001208 [Nepenthes gracilis]|uniref:CDP-diacylglycerol--glycerol-3-phosphate 1-phosphatidyltransferase n=1 Tax=Nepenthes gracilis TaxID=150966 RepID=A0AAD3P419_NEPGR|nr:hypothetical protein Nepgr_001208 [Nepenthes gracilis]
MSVLKLASVMPIPIPICSSKFDKLVRTLTSPSTSSAGATALVSLSVITPQSLALDSKNLSFYVLRRQTMLIPRGHLRSAAYVNSPRINFNCSPLYGQHNNRKTLGFLLLSAYSSASGESGKPVYSSASSESSSSEPFAGPVTNSMGYDRKKDDAVGYDKDVGSSPPPQLSFSSSKDQHSKLLTLPTILTLGRVAAVPIFVGTFYINGLWGTVATTCIFIAAAITDWLDGYIARKMHLRTAFGAFLDPVADKLMVSAALILLSSRSLEVFGDVPWLFPLPAIAIIGREITMSAVREWAASQNSKLLEAVAVNNLGKWKTATQMTALTILLATRDSSEWILVTSGVALLYVSAGLAVWSLAMYMKKIWRVLLPR